MRKRVSLVIWLVVYAFGIISPAKVLAQYEGIRFPQTKEEIALYRKNKVLGETQSNLMDGKKGAYLSRAFDTSGHIVISYDFYHRKYYIYDNHYNVTSYLDSFKKDDGFEVSEYKFKYAANGVLDGVTGPNISSTFKYDPHKRLLTEKLVKSDSIFINQYKYDASGNQIDAQYHDAFGKPVLHYTKTFGPKGEIFNESITNRSDASMDSTLIIYEYNKKNQLFRKQRFTFINFYFNSKGDGKPDRSASHYEVGTFDYTLDDKGRPLSEEFTIKDDKINYHFNTWKYDDNGLTIQESYKIGLLEPSIVVRDYIFFGQ